MTPTSKKTPHFPIDQRERVAQKKADTLLAVDVYEQLNTFVKEALTLSGAANADADLDVNRHHSAILIDGARGTGKSAVLVNLGLYLADVDKETFNKVHIFKPIDPTLLEVHDNLFLNVIVAAILSDKTVGDAQTSYPEKRADLQKQLQRLGTALEGLQKQRKQQGLDKLRSFIGNNQLIEEVHKFFQTVRNLLGKQLLILTIDDVDASLSQAFENLEVVRRYLTSPYVLPIISGDQSLYHEVTWREFHGRLLSDSRYAKKQAFTQAQNLAREYHRKILPLQYRLQMPSVLKYLTDKNICLTSDKYPAMSLPLPIFYSWVEALLNGPVNGLENSYLPVPLTTVRSLAQLINRVAELIPALASSVAKSNLDEMGVKRARLMPIFVIEPLMAFENNYRYSAANRIKAHVVFKDALPDSGGENLATKLEFDRQSSDWYSKLLEHFRFDPLGGAAYLVLQAQKDWYPLAETDKRVRNVFDTPLFQPLKHMQDTFSVFKTPIDLNEWQFNLKGRAPEGWLTRLPTNTLLPYPVPELGRAIASTELIPGTKTRREKIYRFGEGENKLQNNLLLDFMLNKNFYTTNKKAKLVCVGRIVELIIASLVRDIDEQDVIALLQRAPFYSFSDIAGTKTQFISDNDDTPELDWLEDTDAELDQRNEAISLLVKGIASWRAVNRIEELRVSPWLIYNVFNKVMNQAWLFNAPMPLGKVDSSQDERTIARAAKKTFNAVWSAFGSFEKGPFYGLPPVISTVNIGDGEKFENSDLYRQNIAPFYSGENGNTRFYGEQIRSITFLLGEHPIRNWVEQVPSPSVNTPTTSPAKADGGPSLPSEISEQVKRAKAYLADELKVTLKSRVYASALLDALKTNNVAIVDAQRIYYRLKEGFPHAKSLHENLSKAIEDWSAAVATSQMPAE